MSADTSPMVEQADGRNNDTMNSHSLILACITYALVAIALKAETGVWHAGASWPMLIALVVMVYSVASDHFF